MSELQCLLGHTLWAVVLLCKDWRTQYGYSHNLWGYCIVLCNFRVGTEVEYGSDAKGLQLRLACSQGSLQTLKRKK